MSTDRCVVHTAVGTGCNLGSVVFKYDSLTVLSHDQTDTL